MENVSADHPVHKLASKAKWLQSAKDRMKKKGTVGSLTRIAKAHGETAMGYAHEHDHDPDISPSVRKKIQFAENANKGK